MRGGDRKLLIDLYKSVDDLQASLVLLDFEVALKLLVHVLHIYLDLEIQMIEVSPTDQRLFDFQLRLRERF